MVRQLREGKVFGGAWGSLRELGNGPCFCLAGNKVGWKEIKIPTCAQPDQSKGYVVVQWGV